MKSLKIESNDYVIRVLTSPLEVNAADWNTLLASQSPESTLSPFMRHEYLAAMHQSGSATPKTGWTPRFATLWHHDTLVGACALYLKDHSYGEYVFDHAWANAYEQHGMQYYPKALVAPPFTPVPGPRLLARNAVERLLLVKAVIAWCVEEKLSSLHVLFTSDEDVKACEEAGMMLRHTVQFHWTNTEIKYKTFNDFLMSLSQEKRKKIRQERKKVLDAGITFRWSLGKDITNGDWDFFYRCYERTYYEHGNAPYLSRDFFQRMQDTMPENWLMFVAERGEGDKKQKIATSLIAAHAHIHWSEGQFYSQKQPQNQVLTAYGRYWGALARVDCLHFEACYYQPLAWCIDHGYQNFEGGAQGEHKMARALLPVKTTSAHWLAHPSFADAVERFLALEGAGVANYMGELELRSPFKAQPGSGESAR